MQSYVTFTRRSVGRAPVRHLRRYPTVVSAMSAFYARVGQYVAHGWRVTFSAPDSVVLVRESDSVLLAYYAGSCACW